MLYRLYRSCKTNKIQCQCWTKVGEFGWSCQLGAFAALGSAFEWGSQPQQWSKKGVSFLFCLNRVAWRFLGMCLVLSCFVTQFCRSQYSDCIEVSDCLSVLFSHQCTQNSKPCDLQDASYQLDATELLSLLLRLLLLLSLSLWSLLWLWLWLCCGCGGCGGCGGCCGYCYCYCYCCCCCCCCCCWCCCWCCCCCCCWCCCCCCCCWYLSHSVGCCVFVELLFEPGCATLAQLGVGGLWRLADDADFRYWIASQWCKSVSGNLQKRLQSGA